MARTVCPSACLKSKPSPRAVVKSPASPSDSAVVTGRRKAFRPNCWMNCLAQLASVAAVGLVQGTASVLAARAESARLPAASS